MYCIRCTVYNDISAIIVTIAMIYTQTVDALRWRRRRDEKINVIRYLVLTLVSLVCHRAIFMIQAIRLELNTFLGYLFM